MLREIIIWLWSSFIIDPALAEFQARTGAARLPSLAMEQIQNCGAKAPVVLADRVATDPWWAVRTVIGVATGATDGRDILARMTPDCAAAVALAWPDTLQGGS